MNRVVWRVLCVGVVTLVLAGCTSSGSAKQSASVSAPAPRTTAPTTSASPTPTPTPTPTSTAPLSPYEQDPAVKAFRAWAAQAGRTVNSGHYIDAALRALMTPAFAGTMKNVLGADVGLHYPGPVPFTPLSIRDVDATHHTMRLCAVGSGWAQNKTTGRPAAKQRILAADAAAVVSNGRWVVSQFNTATFSCSGVTIPRPTW